MTLDPYNSVLYKLSVVINTIINLMANRDVKSISILLYFKSWKNWNSLSLSVGPPYSSRRPHLPVLEIWQEVWRSTVLTFLKYFCQNANTFCTRRFCLPTFVLTYYFPCITLACMGYWSCLELSFHAWDSRISFNHVQNFPSMHETR